MHRWTYSLLALGLVVGGCQRHQNDTAMVQQQIPARPIVAVVPVIDKSRHNLSWNVSHELTQAIRQKLTQHNQLYLPSADQVYAQMRKSAEGHDPFGLETAWVKKAYPDNEFAAFFELVDHRESPLVGSDNNTEESPAELSLAMRVRVFDLRGAEPKVVLQEIVEQSHHIPKQFTRNQFNQVPWGDEMFEMSPLGLAHEKLSQEISSRIEDYILLSCEKK